jgi:uncharacterized protein YcgL (UPF0745 family)
MKVKVYKARRPDTSGARVFLFIGFDSTVESLPTSERERMGELVLFREMELLPGQQRIAIDTDEALRAIKEKGYYIQGAKIEISTDA